MSELANQRPLPPASPAGAPARNGSAWTSTAAAPGVEQFHPAVARWFSSRFPEGPTEAQAQGWPLVRDGADTLIAAPTGSGKTLAGFLVAIDAAYRAYEAGEEPRGLTRLVYVSPLKALAVDVRENLERPLAEIAALATELALPVPPIQVAVRTGDTTSSARSAMVKTPPTFLVTTPESLYLLVTAQRSRAVLGELQTVIVDEIHALARDKRGSHLALTLERLDNLQRGARPQRIGLSATQRPISSTARLLGGASKPRPRVVDCGHRRKLSVRIELPETELAAVASSEQLAEIVDRIAGHVAGRRTTLVFVNTRRLSERLAHMLGERLGDDQVAAHHGSLSVDRRQRTESRLRAGELRALVATASLELGIDVGPVELVCQVGSPRSIATFLQRVGRSNHSRLGVPEGILFPTTRDELVESAALMAAVHAGRLDAVSPPLKPLDILAQQIVAEVAAAGSCDEQKLFDLVRGAAPYASLSRAEYDSVLELATEGIRTGRGPRMAYLHRDRVNGVLRPRRGARLAALTSGGAIAEVGDYRVVAEPDETTVGSVNEDFAIESMAGDVFLLGTHSWRVQRVSAGEVRVVDAHGANPTIPFWLGEAPARTDELSEEVSELRHGLEEIFSDGDDERATIQQKALEHVQERCALAPEPARQLVEYLSAAHDQLGALPSKRQIVFERFFDEAGGMQLVVHAPFGARVNRAYGLALRKRFCVTFDFELQAAASDDALVLSLGPQHSFPLASAPALVRSASAKEALEQALLVSPMFASRWRWNLNRALAVLRFRGGKKSPIQIQRMEAEDLMAAVFPALAACQENAPPGPIEIPDHVLVRQTLYDTLHEAMDVDGLLALLSRLESGEIRAHFLDSTEPSLLAHEILNGKPYTFLDDAPLEERRTRAVQLRRGLPLEAGDLGRLDTSALERVRREAAPDLREPEELHDLLLALVVCRPDPAHEEWFQELAAAGRALIVSCDGAAQTRDAGEQTHGERTPQEQTRAVLWCATEKRSWAEALFPDAIFSPDKRLSASTEGQELDPDDAAAEVLRGHLDLLGPVNAEQLAARTGLRASRVEVGLARLEAEGFVMRGRFDPSLETPDGPVEQWCARRLLARIHAYTQRKLRREIEPVSPQDFMRFLLRWQHAAAGTQCQARAGVLAVIDKLQGFELAAGAWEEAVLPARVESYQQRWLDDLCLSGEIVWGRFALRAAEGADTPPRRGAATPSRATPITFAAREDLPWLLRAARGDAAPEDPSHGAARELLDALTEQGAMFQAELRAATGRLPAEVEEGLWDLVARGLVSADGFGAVRALFSQRESWRRGRRLERRRRLGGRRAPAMRHGGDGRWALLPAAASEVEFEDPDELAEQAAGQLLARWGVVFHDLLARETLAMPWRELHWALRRLEARGLVRGGRFVNGFAGEQYALVEAVDALRRVRRSSKREELVRLSAADPLNLTGVRLGGERVPALRKRSINYLDGALAPEPPVRAGTVRAAPARQPAVAVGERA